MSRLPLATGLAVGVLAGLAWMSLISSGDHECRVLEAALPPEGPPAPEVQRPYIPVGTRFVVVGSDEVHEVRIPVRLPARMSMRRCGHQRPQGLSGEAW